MTRRVPRGRARRRRSLAARVLGRAASARFLSIATGGTGGVYYPYGGGLAKVLNENLPGVRATAEVTAASVDNLKLIRDGRADIAFTLADTLADAVDGRGAFDGASGAGGEPRGPLLQLHAHRHARRRPASRRSPTCAARRSRPARPGSGTEVIALRVLRAAGLDPDRDVTRQGLGASESADALKDGKVDAFFWSGGLPTAAVQDLAHTPGHHAAPASERRPAARAAARVRRSLLPRSRFRPAPTAASTQPSRSSASPTCSSSTVRCPSSSPTTSRGCCSRSRRSSPRFIPKRATCRSSRRGTARRRRSIRARSATTRSSDAAVDCEDHRCRERRVLTAPAMQAAADRTTARISDEAPNVGCAGWQLGSLATLAIGLSLYALYWVLFIVQPQIYRVSFLLVALVLIFLLVPRRARLGASRVEPLDWVLVAAGDRRAGVAARRLQRVRLPRRRSAADRRRARRR